MLLVNKITEIPVPIVPPSPILQMYSFSVRVVFFRAKRINIVAFESEVNPAELVFAIPPLQYKIGVEYLVCAKPEIIARVSVLQPSGSEISVACAAACCAVCAELVAEVAAEVAVAAAVCAKFELYVNIGLAAVNSSTVGDTIS